MEDYLKIYTIDELFEKAQKEHKQQWTQQRKGKLITAHRRKSLPMRSEKTKDESGSGWKSWGVKDWFDEVNGRQMSVSAKTLDHLMTDEELDHIGRTWSKDKIERLSNETEKYLDLPFSAKQQKKFQLNESKKRGLSSWERSYYSRRFT